jgi:hypothetical protein
MCGEAGCRGLGGAEFLFWLRRGEGGHTGSKASERGELVGNSNSKANAFGLEVELAFCVAADFSAIAGEVVRIVGGATFLSLCSLCSFSPDSPDPDSAEVVGEPISDDAA